MLRGRRWVLRPRPGPGWPQKTLKPLKPTQEAPRSLGSFKPLREALLLLLLLLQQCQAERLERVNFKVSFDRSEIHDSPFLSSMWRGRWSTHAGPCWDMTTPQMSWQGLGLSSVPGPPGNCCHDVKTQFQKHII